MPSLKLSEEETPSEIHRKLSKLTEPQLAQLCLDLDLPWNTLGVGLKKEKVTSIVNHYKLHEKLDELVTAFNSFEKESLLENDHDEKINIEAPTNKVDVLIVTGLPEERDILLSCTDRESWQSKRDALGHPIFQRSFKCNNGTTFTVATASAPKMGGDGAATKAASLIPELKPKCLAMIGICAGRKGKASLGDVLVAERVFNVNYGKLKRYYDKDSNIVRQDILRDLETHNLNPDWKASLQNLENAPINWIDSSIQKKRSKSYEHQRNWLLYRLFEHQNNPEEKPHPISHSERKEECPNWKDMILRLEKEKLLKLGLSIELTKLGEKEVIRYTNLHPDGYEPSDPLESKVLLGPIGSTSEQVQQDPNLFENLESFGRKTLGIEMESSTIGFVGEQFGREVIVVKGVSDFGDHDKDDYFREYAIEASVKFLIAFLKHNPIP